MKTSLTVALVALAVLFVPSSSARACSCREMTPCEAFGYSSAVFVGRMLGGAEKYREYIKDGKTVSLETGQARFAVEESFKGVTATEVTILLMNLKGTSCEGMSALARGERYLVYAGYQDSIGLTIGACSPTKAVEGAKADLEYLRNLALPGAGGRLYGRIGVEAGFTEAAPLADVTVVVEDEAHNQLRVKTDQDGNFEINGLKPGKYLVNPVLPENYVFRDDHQKNRVVQVTDRGCARAPFWININGRVLGTVHDQAGRPAPAVLRLVSISDQKLNLSAYTDDGEYEVTGVPPGQYLLHIDLITGDKEVPYYFPGTNDRSKATVISVAMGEMLEQHDFELPSMLKVKTVQGAVNYSDGRPAADVEVRLLAVSQVKEVGSHAKDMSATRTDALGRFILSGYEGVAYTILAIDDLMRAVEEKRIAGRAETEKMILKKDVDDVKVILPLETNAAAKDGRQKSANTPKKL
jgi:hypothetical protein